MYCPNSINEVYYPIPSIHMLTCCDVAIMAQVFFITDWQHPAWRVVLQKEPRARRVLDNNDEQILGISGELIGLQLPLDLNAAVFRPQLVYAGEVVPAAEVARLNALIRGERREEHVYAVPRAQRGRGGRRGRGRHRGRVARRNPT